MQESYFKCPCEHCGTHIEFPAEGLDQTVVCPHCKKNTHLAQSASKPVKAGIASKLSRSGLRLPIAMVFVVVVLGVGIGLLAGWKHGFWKASQRNPAMNAATNTNAVATNAIPAPDFETNGLQAFAVTLEKPDGGGLIYASGTVRNQSERQRFGVKVRLDLLDAADASLGSATDYAPVIEPHKEWKFRALVTEPKAVKAKVVGLTEK